MVAEVPVWEKLYEDGLEKQYSGLIHEARKKAERLGIGEWLWPFQYQDVIRASLKQNVLIAYLMGLGKTR